MLDALVLNTGLKKLSSCLRYLTLYEIAPSTPVQPNVIEAPDFEMILTTGSGHERQTVRIFENARFKEPRSAKTKKALRKSCQLNLHKFLIVEKLDCEKDDRCYTGDFLSHFTPGKSQ